MVPEGGRECVQILVSLARAYKTIVPSGVIITKTSNEFSSPGLPARATLTATLESRGWMTPRGCKAVPGSVWGWVYLTEEIRRKVSIPGERCLRRKGPAGARRTGAAPMTAIAGLSQPAEVTRCPCRAGSPLFSSLAGA
jgi:hypothetical protein